MKVADLRQHLADLARVLDAAGAAKSVSNDQRAIADGISPFADQTLPAFASFLAKAHEYQTTGQLSVASRPARAPRAAKAPKADPVEVARAVRQLYDRAGDLSLSADEIEAGLKPLEGLPKAGLTVVCTAMEIKPISKWKLDDYRAAIRQRILDRRSAAQRAAMIAGDAQHPE